MATMLYTKVIIRDRILFLAMELKYVYKWRLFIFFLSFLL